MRERSALALAALMGAGVLINALVHDPHVGYDAWDHLRYVETLSEGRLPLPADTREFFSPPAPYALPALARRAGLAFPWTAKLAQLQNALWALGLSATLVAFCRRLRPGSWRLPLTALALLGTLPVYYKSFAQVRGEPLVAFLAVACVAQAWLLFLDARGRLRAAVLVGALLGAVGLARQWGVLLYPAVGAFALVLAARRVGPRRLLVAKLGVVAAVVLLVAGWFYLRHVQLFGSPAAFNREPAALSWNAQPASFYRGLGDGRLFTAPVREAFPNQLWPIFYSEVWGDYWSYFSARQMPRVPLHAGRAHVAPNLESMAPYLGRVNAASLLPSLLYVAGFAYGAAQLLGFLRGSPSDAAFPRRAGLALCWLAVVCTLLGYGWFLFRYPSVERGDTVKATYVLQVFPFAALLAADWLEWLRARWRAGYALCGALLLLVALHNLPACFTRYPGAWPDVPLFVAGDWRVPKAPDAAAGSPGGIAAEYFRGESFDEPAAARIESRIDLRTFGAAAPGVGEDRFSARFRGWIFFPAEGRQLLCEESDDGARVRFDGAPLIDDWSPHAGRIVCEPVRVRRGWYPLEVDYYDRDGASILRLLRGTARGRLRPVPPAHLCCRAPAEGGA